MSKTILFVVNTGTISSNENGGASVYFSHLELLAKAGFTIQLLAVEWPNSKPFNKTDYKEIEGMVDSILTCKPVLKLPFKNLNRITNAIFKPEVFEYYFLNTSNKTYLKNIVTNHAIDLVWAEWRWAGIWACFSQLNIPVLYAHHDWEYKLAKLRKTRTLLERFHTFQKKRTEFKLVKMVDGCVSGSHTETKEIAFLKNAKALYLPTTYHHVDDVLETQQVPNIVHLGGMGTTANRLGLERFLTICWNEIKRKHPQVRLKVIGSLDQAPSSLSQKLKDPNIDCLGFVENLSGVMHKRDIHIIPWEYNTGTRTRLPLVLNYQQVLVATEASVKGFPEIKNNENAVLCNTLKDMKNEICELILDSDRLNTLSKAGKETFFNKFTVKSQVENLKTFIDKLL